MWWPYLSETQNAPRLTHLTSLSPHYNWPSASPSKPRNTEPKTRGMSSFNSNHGKPHSPPRRTPVPLPRYPSFNPSLGATPSHDAPGSLPKFPSSTYQGHNPSMGSTSNHHKLTGQSIQRISGSSTQGAHSSQVSSSRLRAPGFEITLSAPATPHQYETVDEPEDELQAADELALTELRPQVLKNFTTVVRERPSHSPIPNIITPVPLPKTAALGGTSTLQQQSGTSTPGSKSGKKGRPKGWRRGMSYAAVRNFGPEVAAKFAAMNPVGNRHVGTAKLAQEGSRKRTRPARAAAPAPGTQAIRTKKPKAASPPPRKPPIDIFMDWRCKIEPFKCEWAGCQSRLHNLWTLEKHVDVVHCPAERKECLLGKCAYADIRFDTDEQLGAHLREAHFSPYAWYLGDGPKISFGIPEPDPSDTPKYLLGKDGKQVTDSVQNQEVEDKETRVKRKKEHEASQQKSAQPYEVDSENEDDAMLLGWSSGYP